MKYILYLSCFLASHFAFSQNNDSTKAIKDSAKIVENNLPNISLKKIDGTSVLFNEFANNGQITIVSFWATWCKPCIMELKNIDPLYEEWQSKYNIRLIAVSVDDSRTSPKVKPYVNSQGWTYEILLDINSELRRAMNVTNPPTTFLIDKNGKIVYTHTGYLEGDELELEKKIQELTEAKH